MTKGGRFCPNHPARALTPSAVRAALIVVDETGEGLNLEKGIELVPYACLLCGYVELYLTDVARFPRR